MSFAERIRVSRKEKGYSQEMLAEKVNVSRQTVTKWETENAYPETKTLLLLSVVLEKDLDWLFSDDLLAVRVQNNHILQELEKEKVMVRQVSSVNRVNRNLVNTALDELQILTKRAITKAGYRFIDDGRGWINQVYVLYGAPAIGKTAFALNIVNNVIREDGHVAYFDLSRPVKEDMKKLLGISAKVSTAFVTEYNRAEKARLEKAADQLQNSSLFMEHVYEDPIEKIHEKCLNIDPLLDLIVIDGADHLFSAKHADDNCSNEYWINQELQEMVRTCRCPVLLLKEPTGRVKKMLDHNMDGKTVLQELESENRIDGEVWLFQRADYNKTLEQHNYRTALTMKNRFSEEDMYLTGFMQFETETLRLTEIRRDADAT